MCPSMQPWHTVVEPAREIQEGRVDESTFAASLSDVVAGRAALEYRDASTFFAKTYHTRGLVQLLAAVAARLAGAGRGEPVIQIQTPFGGGKTHALVALYHFGREPEALNPEAADQVRRESGVQAFVKPRWAVFDGTAGDPLGRTPWGELAQQLGKYDLLREHDRQRRTPGTELLHRLLGDEPTLILMDEIAEYAAKATDIREQVMAFFQELTETVKALPRCVLVVTLPSSAPYGEEGERALDQLERIFGRVEAIYTPVEGAEVYEVIRRRLFRDLGDPTAPQVVADAYWQLYQRLGDDAPAEAREPGYRDKLRLAYPFHPQIVDILYERWSTFHTFQRTRGVLRLLANVVADLWQLRHPAPLIQAAHINLANADTRREFLKHIGNEYEGVIAADIVDTNARAQRIDREMGSEYARFGVASGLATAIFFGSFSGSERRGVNVPNLRLALLREGIPPAIVGDALGRMEDELWYLHVEGGLYQFRNRPNLNRVLLEHEEAISDDQVAEELEARLRAMAGSELRVTVYPCASGDIPDNRELKLALLSGDHPGGTAATADFVGNLLNRAGTAFRVYRNALLALAPDAGELAAARRLARRFLALCNIQQDSRLMATLSDDDRATVSSRHGEANGNLDFQLVSAYRYLARAGGEDVQWLNMGLPIAGERGSLARRVVNYLKAQDRLLDRIAPRHLVEKGMADQEQEKPLREVREAFLRYPHLPMLASEQVFREAVLRGVREGTFGVRHAGALAFRQPLAEDALDDEATIVRAEVAEAERRAEVPTGGPPEPRPTPPEPVPGQDGTGVREPGPQPGSAEEATRRVSLRVRVPWEKMSDFIRGVLMPLHLDGAALDVEINIRAVSEAGIKRATLEQKVEETLRQIGAEVLARENE